VPLAMAHAKNFSIQLDENYFVAVAFIVIVVAFIVTTTTKSINSSKHKY
jgi:hypothetical protein